MGSPASPVLCRRSDSLAVVPRRSACTRVPVPTSPAIRFHGRRAQIAVDLGCGHPASLTGFTVERQGPPRFLGNPRADMPCSLTPVGPSRQAIATCRCCLPPISRRRLPQHLSFRSSITRPVGSLCTLRHVRCRTPRNTRFRLLATLCRVGLATHRVPSEGFAFQLLLSPGFPGARDSESFGAFLRGPNVTLGFPIGP